MSQTLDSSLHTVPIAQFKQAFLKSMAGDVQAFIKDIGVIVRRRRKIQKEIESLDAENPRLPALRHEKALLEAMEEVSVNAPLFKHSDCRQVDAEDRSRIPEKRKALNEQIASLPIETQLWLHKANPSWKAQFFNAWYAGDPDKSCAMFLRNLAVGNPAEIAKMSIEDLVKRGSEVSPVEIPASVEQRMRECFESAEELHRLLTDAREKVAGKTLPGWCEELSVAYCTFLERLFNRAAKGVGLTNYTLLAVGSLARREVCPYSDIDFQLILDPKQLETGLQEIEVKFREIVAFCNALLEFSGEQALDEMDMKIKDFSPEAMARKHVRTKMDVIQDILVLGEESDDLATYREEVQKVLQNPVLRQQCILPEMNSSFSKFNPDDSQFWKAGSFKDVKKGLLRLPTFLVRNLTFYYGLEAGQQDVKSRCDLLVERKLMDRSVADSILAVCEVGLSLRKELHEFYGGECELVLFEEDAERLGMEVEVKAEGGKQKREAFQVMRDSWHRRVMDQCLEVNRELQRRMETLLDAHVVRISPDSKEWAEPQQLEANEANHASDANRERLLAAIRQHQPNRLFNGTLPPTLRNLRIASKMRLGAFPCTFEELEFGEWKEQTGQLKDGVLLKNGVNLFDKSSSSSPVVAALDNLPRPFTKPMEPPSFPARF